MSRTWRKLPRTFYSRRNEHRKQGGAAASAGPSPARRRPDGHYDSDVLDLAVGMLESETSPMSSDTAIVPDGRQQRSGIIYTRDNRVTGLRNADHRRARRDTRQRLADAASESAENVRAGKARHYTDQYGDYNF